MIAPTRSEMKESLVADRRLNDSQSDLYFFCMNDLLVNLKSPHRSNWRFPKKPAYWQERRSRRRPCVPKPETSYCAESAHSNHTPRAEGPRSKWLFPRQS